MEADNFININQESVQSWLKFGIALVQLYFPSNFW